MKRSVYVIVDKKKNDFATSFIANGNDDALDQLRHSMQNEHMDVELSCYRVQNIQLDDDNNFFFYSSKNPDLPITPIWCSIDEKSVNAQQLKSIIQEEEDNEHLQ